MLSYAFEMSTFMYKRAAVLKAPSEGQLSGGEVPVVSEYNVLSPENSTIPFRIARRTSTISVTILLEDVGTGRAIVTITSINAMAGSVTP